MSNEEVSPTATPPLPSFSFCILYFLLLSIVLLTAARVLARFCQLLRAWVLKHDFVIRSELRHVYI